MIHPQLQRLAQEWRQSRRLRLGVLAIVLVLGAHVAVSMSDRRTGRVEQYQRDAELLGRLQEASRESAWPQRAQAAEAMLADVRHSIPAARSDGLAQAEMQAWLTDLAAFAGLAQPTVRVETSLAVPGHAGLWQVLARLDGGVPDGRMPVLVRVLSLAMPWVRTERLEIQTGRDARVSLVVRGYFREADARDAVAPPARPAALPAAADAPPVPATPMISPLARQPDPRTTAGRTQPPRPSAGNPLNSSNPPSTSSTSSMSSMSSAATRAERAARFRAGQQGTRPRTEKTR